MISPETTDVVGQICYYVAVIAIIFWAAIDMGFWPDLRDKNVRSSHEMHKKYSPLWWQRFSRWFWVSAIALCVVGYLLSTPHTPPKPRPSLWEQFFGRDK